jgi:hypothetical protein
LGEKMDLQKLLAEHPSIIGITIAIIILAFIAITILTTKRP